MSVTQKHFETEIFNPKSTGLFGLDKALDVFHPPSLKFDPDNLEG